MNKLLQSTRYLVLVAVLCSLAAAIAAFGWCGVRTYQVIRDLFAESPHGSDVSVAFIALMDTMLIATGLLIFAIGLYELFIAELEVPAWLKLRTLHDLKARLSSIIILVITVAFVEHLVQWRAALDTLLFGVAVAVVSAVLIAFGHFHDKE